MWGKSLVNEQNGEGRFVVQSLTVSTTVPFLFKVYIKVFSRYRADGNCLHARWSYCIANVPVAQLKQAETASVLLDYFAVFSCAHLR